MFWRRRHLSDAELLLVAESELPARRERWARHHLEACPRCAARARSLQRESDRVMRADLEPTRALPMPEMARARLLARLGEPSSPSGRWWTMGTAGWQALVVGVAAGVALALVVPLDRRRPEPPPASRSEVAGTTLPRPDLTPGAARPVSVEEVCAPARPPRQPPVDVMTAQQVFEHYGADFRRAEDYELDFLITPELGGTADIQNLWPQPYTSTTWNAYVKDELEQLFRERVCAGTMDIATAQQEIATDWIAAYRRYFDTEQPRRPGAPRDG